MLSRLDESSKRFEILLADSQLSTQLLFMKIYQKLYIYTSQLWLVGLALQLIQTLHAEQIGQRQGKVIAIKF